MNAYMLEKWNKKVRRNDDVIILGDLSWGKADETNRKWIKPYEEMQDNRRKVVLCHYPIMCYNGQ